MEKRTEPSAESGRSRGRPSTCSARTDGGEVGREASACNSPRSNRPKVGVRPVSRASLEDETRVGPRVGSFENAARSRVVRPIRGSTPTARPTANKYREGKLKRTLKRESKRTRNRPKEKKPRGRAGVRLGRSVALAKTPFLGRRADRCRPLLEEGRDQFGPDRSRSATNPIAVRGGRRRELPRSRPGPGDGSLLTVESAAHSARALATRLETRTEESNACASKENEREASMRSEGEQTRSRPPATGASRIESGVAYRPLLGAATKRGSNRSAFARTRKMVNYARAGRSRTKVRWKAAAILTCKSIVRPKRRGERPIEPSNSWFPPKFPSG